VADPTFTEEVFDPCDAEGEGVRLEDFVAFMPSHGYIYTPCREMWSQASVNSRIGPVQALDAAGNPKQRAGKPEYISASAWLDQNSPVEQMTWQPGMPMMIPDRLGVDGGWIERKGVTSFNQYRPPRIKHGDRNKAVPWVDHAYTVFGEAAPHLIRWMAQRVQNPGVKINHALVLGGAPGIGKDTLLAPLKEAVGPWNFREVSPAQMLGRFNGFVKSVVLRVSEARDLGDVNRFAFYDHTKVYAAAPPDVLRVDEKYLPPYYASNCLGLILTTNHKTDGIYLPADDRRHYVAWSNLVKADFKDSYWTGIWGFYADGGYEHVAAYLANFDLSNFDPYAPPPKTPAFWDIVNATRAPEDGELADVIDALGNPDALVLKHLQAKAAGETLEWLMERKNRRALPHRLERCGYVSVNNPYAKSGLWKMAGARQVIYAKASLNSREQYRAAQVLMKE
jgi:Family of unknown function (DUF5906)